MQNESIQRALPEAFNLPAFQGIPPKPRQFAMNVREPSICSNWVIFL
jgi:hypothetical protein